MELLLVLLFMGLGMLVPATIIGLVIYWAIYSNRKRGQAWSSVAQRLGLYYQANRIWGYLDGQHVQCQTVQRGSGRNKQTWTVVTGFFHPRLDLGLSVYKQRILADAFGSLFGSEDIEVGDAGFDASFVIKGDEPARVMTLLRPDVRHHLRQCQQGGWTAKLNDLGMSVERYGGVSNEAWLEQALRTVAGGAAMVTAARDSVPIASPLQPHYESWTSYARAQGMQGTTTPFCMWGDIDGSQVTVSAVRAGKLKYNVQVLVHYPSMLQHGLTVRPSGTMDAVVTFFGGQDHRTGHQAFDQAFTVKSNRPDQIRQIFDANVCSTLLGIKSNVGPVEVRDDGVAVTTRGFPQHPTQVPQLVNAVKDVARAIHSNAYQIYSVQEGPYR